MAKAGDAFLSVVHPAKALQVKAEKEAADKALKSARGLRKENFDLAGQLDWEPDYVSDLMPAYQRAQSPVARSFLESLLTGANPSMVQGTRLGADRLRAGAQANFDQQTGGWDALLARQREIERETPWAPKKFSAPAVQKLPQQSKEPPWMGAVRKDPNGQTDAGAAALQEMWGLGPDSDYWAQLEAAVGHPVPRTVRRG